MCTQSQALSTGRPTITASASAETSGARFLSLSDSASVCGRAGPDSNVRAVALTTDADTDGLPALLGLLVLKGVDIRGGARGQLLWSSARMRLHSRAHKQNQSTERETERVTENGE